MVTRIAFQTAMRAACVSLLEGYASDAMIELQVYPGRPKSIYPPTAFVDGIDEPNITYTAGLRQRTPQATVILIHGLYDSEAAAVQKDAFMDAFLDWVTDNPAGAGASTLIEIVRTEDLPDFIPTWLPEQLQQTYYATRIVLEGLALDGRIN
jgi:hypothetical protein